MSFRILASASLRRWGRSGIKMSAPMMSRVFTIAADNVRKGLADYFYRDLMDRLIHHLIIRIISSLRIIYFPISWSEGLLRGPHGATQ